MIQEILHIDTAFGKVCKDRAGHKSIKTVAKQQKTRFAVMRFYFLASDIAQ
jgi:hypothetical protein